MQYWPVLNLHIKSARTQSAYDQWNERAGTGAGTHTENDAENMPYTQMPTYYAVGLTQTSVSNDLHD